MPAAADFMNRKFKREVPGAFNLRLRPGQPQREIGCDLPKSGTRISPS